VAKVNPEGQKEQILNAAAKLFIEKGFGGASMQEIAEALGAIVASSQSSLPGTEGNQ